MTFHLICGMWMEGYGYEVSEVAEAIRVTDSGVECFTSRADWCPPGRPGRPWSNRTPCWATRVRGWFPGARAWQGSRNRWRNRGAPRPPPVRIHHP